MFILLSQYKVLGVLSLCLFQLFIISGLIFFVLCWYVHFCEFGSARSSTIKDTLQGIVF